MDFSTAVSLLSPPTIAAQLKGDYHSIDASLNSNQCAHTSCSIAFEIRWCLFCCLLLFKYIFVYILVFVIFFFVSLSFSWLHCFTTWGQLYL